MAYNEIQLLSQVHSPIRWFIETENKTLSLVTTDKEMIMVVLNLLYEKKTLRKQI